VILLMEGVGGRFLYLLIRTNYYLCHNSRFCSFILDFDVLKNQSVPFQSPKHQSAQRQKDPKLKTAFFSAES
jgi:hypothetical protein